MATIKGQNLRLFMDNGNGQMSAIAAAQQCQLSLRLEVKQTSTKDDTDDFAKNIALKLSWSVSASGVVTIEADLRKAFPKDRPIIIPEAVPLPPEIEFAEAEEIN